MNPEEIDRLIDEQEYQIRHSGFPKEVQEELYIVAEDCRRRGKKVYEDVHRAKTALANGRDLGESVEKLGIESQRMVDSLYRLVQNLQRYSANQNP